MKRSVLVAFMCAVAMAVSAPAAMAAPAEVSNTVGVKMKATAQVSAVACDNTGSTISIGGTLESEGIETRIKTYQNVNKQRVYDGVLTLQLTPFGTDANGDLVQGIEIPKQPSQGGVGGNPWISFAFTDENATPLASDYKVLGRCVQGISFSVFEADALVNNNVKTLVTGLECSQKSTKLHGKKASVNSNGINGTVLLDNNINKAVHQSQAAAKLAAVFMPSGVQSMAQGGRTGTGGNPHVEIEFGTFDGAGVFAKQSGAELGRCKQMMR